MPDETKEQLKAKIEELEEEVKELKQDHGDEDKYATIGSRVLSTIIDVVLIVVSWVIIAIIVGMISEGDMIFWWLVVIMFLCLPFAYFIFLEGGIGKGQTVGKRLLHIKVIKENGEPPSYFQSFTRTFTRFLDLYFIYHIIGLAVACLTERRQRVGDLLAKTLVVREDVTDPPRSKAEKKSTLIVVLLAVIVIFMVILTVVIVGITLWYMGVFNLGGTAKTMTGFEAVKPMSWGVNVDGSAVITMVSGEGTRINLTVCSMSMYGNECGTCMLPENSEVEAGNMFQITVDPSYDCEGIAGEPYEADISISYDKQIGTYTESHTSVGTITGPYE